MREEHRVRLIACMRTNSKSLCVNGGNELTIRGTRDGKNGVVGKMEELLASLPMFSLAINALSHSAAQP